MKKINVSDWGDFNIYDLFEIDSGSKLDRRRMPLGNDINFIGRTGINNGINATTTYVEGIKPYEPGLITLALGGSIGACFVQDKPFYTSQNVVVLKPLPGLDISDNSKQFIATCIYKESQLNYKAFVKELNKHIKTDFSFKLPQKDDGSPDWGFMDYFIKKQKETIVNKFENFNLTRDEDSFLDIEDWGYFKINDIFPIIKRPSARTISKYIPGDVAFVSSGNYNNAVVDYREPIEGEKLDKGNCITVSPVDGSTFYQPLDFLGRGGGGSSIMMLYNDKLNEYSGLFISAVIRSFLSKKYEFGDMGNSTTIRNEKIKLPKTSEGEVDWDFMENYIMQSLKNSHETLETLIKAV